MTIKEIAMLGKDFHDNYYSKYHHYVVTTYKYHGEIKTRKRPELTDEGRKIMISEALNTKVFTCPCCGKKFLFENLNIGEKKLKK